jgi:hypothetical protein
MLAVGGLNTGSEIAHLLATCSIGDVDPTLTKRHRLYKAFVKEQNQRQDRTRILGFIRHSMKPARFVKFSERFEPMRTHLNEALAFAGLAVDASGTLAAVRRSAPCPKRSAALKSCALTSPRAAFIPTYRVSAVRNCLPTTIFTPCWKP